MSKQLSIIVIIFGCCVLLAVEISTQATHKSKITKKLRSRHPTAAKQQAISLPAAALSFTGGVITTESEVKGGFRVHDKVIFLRHTTSGWILDGRGEVQRAYKDGGVLIDTANPSFGIHIEDDIYIVNRDNSPYSLSNFHYEHAKDIADDHKIR